MTQTQKEAVIVCLYKKVNKKDINNWRPISLLNTDYKILTKIIANRLKHILPQIIDECQTACIPKRTVYSNLSYTRDIIKIANEKKMDASITSIDQGKAFDRVDRIFLYDSLQFFGFRVCFINFIKTIYRFYKIYKTHPKAKKPVVLIRHFRARKNKRFSIEKY